MDANELVYRAARIEEIISLRHAELRTHLPRETAEFDGDTHPFTMHFGAFDPDGANLCCASMMPNPFLGSPAYQLRGMATRKDWVGQGVGARLLSFAETTILETTPIRQLWCNARVPAVGFYKKQGWVVVSEEFAVPTAGPHYRMAKKM